MRLVRLKLRACPFWNLLPIELNNDNPTSPILDIDLLTERQSEIIDKSIIAGDIKLTGPDGDHIEGSLKTVNIIEGNYVSDDDVEEDDIPAIISVTVESESQEDSSSQPDGPSEETLADAVVLLARNGNTVKKTILAFEQTDQNLMFLHACLIEETNNKQRSGVLHLIKQIISEY